MPLAHGTRLGPYEITAPLGAGGMGEVYRAHDARLGRDVALKVLPESLTADETARARLIREARAAAALSHPNICAVFEVGEATGRTYIAMELVEGRTLSKRIAGSPLPVESVIAYGAQIASALGEAHDQKILHRDLKSSNVVITHDGRAKVLDFGLAKRVWENPSEADTSSDSLTATGIVVGTLHYLAPEVLRGMRADERSDIWALGVLLYEMSAGVLPFRGRTPYELVTSILNDSPPPLPARLPAGLRGLIARCLAKEAGERLQRASEVRSALEAMGTSADHVSLTSYARRWAIPLVATIALVGVAPWLVRTFSLGIGPHSGKTTWSRTQLTTNSSENSVRCAEVSSDGSQVLYVDDAGLNLRAIATGDTRSIPIPDGLPARAIRGLSWYQDGSRFLIWAARDMTRAAWVVSPLSGTYERVDFPATFAVPSPDGTRIAFLGGENSSEIWVSNENGEQAERILSGSLTRSHFTRICWSPDSRRIAYLRLGFDPKQPHWHIESCDLKGTAGTTILEGGRLETTPTGLLIAAGEGAPAFAWLPNNRLVYTRVDRQSPVSMELYEQALDPRTAMTRGQRRLVMSLSDDAQYLGPSIPPGLMPGLTLGGESFYFGFSLSSDARRFLLLKAEPSTDILVADLSGGRLQQAPRRLTLDERDDEDAIWEPDGGSLIFISDRGGNSDIYRQGLGEATSRRVAVTSDWERSPIMLPGEGAILYQAKQLRPDSSPRGSPYVSGKYEFRKRPLAGGPSEVFAVLDSFPEIRWAAESGVCFVATRNLKSGERVLSTRDPSSGALTTITRVKHVRPLMTFTWDVSPDGSQVAYALGDSIFLIHVGIPGVAHIVAKGWHDLRIQQWLPSGRGWLTLGRSRKDAALLRVDSMGRCSVVWSIPEDAGDCSDFRLSPDESHLSFTKWNGTTNAWLFDRPNR